MANYRSSSGNILLLAYRRFDTKLVPEKCNIKFFLKLRNNKMYTILVYMYMYMCDVMCMCDVKVHVQVCRYIYTIRIFEKPITIQTYENSLMLPCVYRTFVPVLVVAGFALPYFRLLFRNCLVTNNYLNVFQSIKYFQWYTVTLLLKAGDNVMYFVSFAFNPFPWLYMHWI